LRIDGTGDYFLVGELHHLLRLFADFASIPAHGNFLQTISV